MVFNECEHAKRIPCSCNTYCDESGIFVTKEDCKICKEEQSRLAENNKSILGEEIELKEVLALTKAIEKFSTIEDLKSTIILLASHYKITDKSTIKELAELLSLIQVISRAGDE